jgi:lipoprotein-releasing system permease protein
MADITGHVQIVVRSKEPENWMELYDRLRKLEPDLKAALPFLRVEALLARGGKIQGVFLQAVDQSQRDSVMNLRSRVVAGDLSLEPEGEIPAALIGKGLAAQFGLKPGDRIRLVIPIADSYNAERFSRKVGEFVVRGVVDMGKFDWNERFLLTDLAPVQALAEMGSRYHGLQLRFGDPESGRIAGFRLSQQLGPGYYVTDWHEMNANLFEAVRLERVVIFFVVFIIIIVSAFNIAATLFVNVVRRTPDIAILKSLGLSSRSVIRIFGAQGLLLGLLGFTLGTLLGLLLCEGFNVMQQHFQLMAGSVYKVEGIRASVRPIDLLAIGGATIGICFFATLAPAWRGARLRPTEGLRYE